MEVELIKFAAKLRDYFLIEADKVGGKEGEQMNFIANQIRDFVGQLERNPNLAKRKVHLGGIFGFKISD